MVAKLITQAAIFAGSVVKYGCIFHCYFEYVSDFVRCAGPSMEPTLHTNNVLLTERISKRFNGLNRGNIIVSKSPTNPEQFICKRIIGLPGDKVIIKPRINFNPFANTKSKEIYVPKGMVWLEGDNSANSSDSRIYGPVPLGLIQSRVICKVWPPNQIKILI